MLDVCKSDHIIYLFNYPFYFYDISHDDFRRFSKKYKINKHCKFPLFIFKSSKKNAGIELLWKLLNFQSIYFNQSRETFSSHPIMKSHQIKIRNFQDVL